MRDFNYKAYDAEKDEWFEFDLNVCQWTGLMKGEEKVYENDILERSASNGKGKVRGRIIFKDACFKIEWAKGEWNDILSIHLPDCEIVGNYCQCPELLEAVQK